MKRLFIFLSLVACLISGCSFDVHMVTPLPVEETLPPVTPIIFPPAAPVSIPG